MLEVGPGVGALTSALCETASKVIAIELDERVLAALQEVAPQAEILQADVLKTDLNAILAKLPEPRCLVSNMPYSITGPLLTKIAECRSNFSNAVLMMQREVGRRVLADAGDRERGSLSVFLQLQFEITKVCDVPAAAFWPPPKVDSVVLNLIPRKIEIDEKKEAMLFKLIRTGFKQPRKTLVNNLVDLHGRQKVEQALDGLGHKRNVRPHQIDNKDWLALAEAL